MAGIMAGYSQDDSLTIAHAGQYIDDADENKLIHRNDIPGFKPLATALPTASEISRNTVWDSGVIARDRKMWTTFHFLPGNLSLTKTYRGNKDDYGRLEEIEFKSMCLPDSPLVIDMINDTVTNHSNDLHLIGVRIHGLLDTFSHMYYAGSAARHVNDVPERAYYWFGGKWEYLPWTPFAYAPDITGSNDAIAMTGHGRMGHVPDLPWIKYRYKPNWSSDYMVKDNPADFKRAFREMVHALMCIKDLRVYAPLENGQLPNAFSKYKGFLDKIDTIIDTIPEEANTRYIRENQVDDFFEERCNLWINSFPLHISYNPDQWYESALSLRESSAFKNSDYYGFHQAANYQLNFVSNWLAQRDIDIFGTSCFSSREDLARHLDRDIYIKPGFHNTECYLEIEDNSTAEYAAIQLWNINNKNRKNNIWRITFAGRDSANQNDLFYLHNPYLNRYAGFVLHKDQQFHNGHITSHAFNEKIKSKFLFKIKRNTDGTFSFFVLADEEPYTVVPEDGNLGDSTKLVVMDQGANHPDWSKWHIHFDI
jgi:hypothetical protein